MIEFEVSGDPVPKGRPKLSRGGHAYTPERTKEGERIVRAAFEECRMTRFGIALPAPVELEMELWFATATRRRSDIDNYAKLVMDALNQAAYDDDSQITRLVANLERGVGKDNAHSRVQIRERSA